MINKFGSVGEEMGSSLCVVVWILPLVFKSDCSVGPSNSNVQLPFHRCTSAEGVVS